MAISITGLNYQATAEDIQELFSEYGEVVKVTIILDRETGKPRGTANVVMGSDAQETGAIEALNGTEWMGKTMKVGIARPSLSGGSRKRPQGGTWE